MKSPNKRVETENEKKKWYPQTRCMTHQYLKLCKGTEDSGREAEVMRENESQQNVLPQNPEEEKIPRRRPSSTMTNTVEIQ